MYATYKNEELKFEDVPHGVFVLGLHTNKMNHKAVWSSFDPNRLNKLDHLKERGMKMRAEIKSELEGKSMINASAMSPDG